MQNIYTPAFKKLLLLLVIIVFAVRTANGQAEYVPYSYQFDQKLNADVYSVNTSFHTTLKPFLIDTAIGHGVNYLMSICLMTTRKIILFLLIF